MKRFLLALKFLTVFPVRLRSPIQDADYGRSLLYFPLVGLVIGMTLAAGAFIFAPLPDMLRSALIVLLSVLITGALHLDGFADTCDGFYGLRSKEEVLRIMRDSHVGTMAVTGVVVLLLLKFSLLAGLAGSSIGKALILAGVFSRWAQSLACVNGPYARKDGKARFFVEHAHKKDVFYGGLFSLLLFVILLGFKGVILFISLFAAVAIFLRYVNKKISGVTGDTIGAVNEIAEVLTLLAIIVSI